MMESIDWNAWGPALSVIVAGLSLGLLFGRSGSGASRAQDTVEADLRQERTNAVESLKRLEAEKDKFSDEDYQSERTALLTRGANALRALDEMAPTPTPAPKAAAAGGLAPEWRGALAVLCVVLCVGVFWSIASNEAVDRPRGGSMTGGNASAMADQKVDMQARLEANPQDLEAANLLTRFAIMEGDATGAMEWNQRASAISENDPGVRTYRAVLAALVGMDARALEQLEKVTQDHPDFADAWSYLGVLQLRQASVNEAVASLERAVALNPADPGLRQTLEQARVIAQAQANPVDLQQPAEAQSVASGTLSLAEDLAASVVGTETLYLSVRSPGGGPPLAAKKLPVGAYPQAFALTTADAIAMGGAPRPFPENISLTVRIDGDGNPLTKDDVLAEAVVPSVTLGQGDIILELTAP
jgi:cytochrome c-type biogenesis protein CcmH